jgi:hypothetical protein
VPIRISNPSNGMSTPPIRGLLDTGADKCLLSSSTPIVLMASNTGPKTHSFGIGTSALETYPYRLRIELLSSDARNSLWDSGTIEINCAAYNNKIPPLLGSSDFLRHFDIAFNYRRSIVTITY